MNKTSREKKTSARRLIALLLCCLCLLTAIPIAAMADVTDDELELTLDAVTPEEEVLADPDLTLEEEPALTFYDRLVSAQCCGDIYALLAADENQAEVLALTGDQLQGVLDHALALGDDGYLADVAQVLNALMAQPDGEAEEPDLLIEEEEDQYEDEYEDESHEDDYYEEPEEEDEDEWSDQDAADELYWRLMDCETLDEMNDILDNLTWEEEELLYLFTDEQNANLEEKMAQLGAYEVETLQNRDYTIKQGGTEIVSITTNSFSSMNGSLRYECSQSGITATINSQQGWSTTYTGYTISVGNNVPAGTYTLTVNYEVTSLTWSGVTTTTYTDTITVTVTSSSTTGSGSFVVTNTMTNVDVVYARIDRNTTVNDVELIPVASGQEVRANISDGALVFFVKPKEGYLLTQFYRSDNVACDMYSTETTASGTNIGFFESHADIGDIVLQVARKAGYIGYYGFTNPKATYTAPFVEVAEAPQMNITATASPNADLKPGDKVTFTIAVTPGDLSTAADYTVTNKKITELTINGIPYTATQNADGTYSVEYVITEEDWVNQRAVLDVTASLTYNYEVPVTDRVGSSEKIRTNATITSSATTDCAFATKKGVVYQVSFDPADKADPDLFPNTPVDNNTYFEGSSVTVNSEYGKDSVVDPVNGGTWRFDGWYHGTEKVGETLTMGDGGILLTGKWTFTPNPTTTVTITKMVDGNMGNHNESFNFTVSGESVADDDKSFTLKHGESKTITVNIGDTITVTEADSGYDVSYEITAEGANKVTGTGNSVEYTVQRDVSNQTITFTNYKNITLDTGVLLDTLPYIIILVVVAAGAVLMLKKRSRRED